MKGIPLQARVLKIDLGRYQVVLHHQDAEDLGVHAQDRVRVTCEGDSITAIVDTTDSFISPGEVGVFLDVQHRFDLENGTSVTVAPAERPQSVITIKKKMQGKELSTEEIDRLVADIVDGSISDIELAAWVTAVEVRDLNMRETQDLTMSMVRYGETIDFGDKVIFDKHSIGGVPGNKISLLIVPIVAAAGLLIPKTSSRAITGAAGTADVMEVFCNVKLDADEIRRITLETGAVLAWGGGVNLAPADDIIIRAEHPLSLDPRAQLLASVMAKKKAVSANHCVIDIPMGEGTKIPTMDEARKLAREFLDLGERLGINMECAVTYGGQPVGKTVGPALEANEALEALRSRDHTDSLTEKSTALAGILLEMGGAARRGEGKRMAEDILTSGKALEKFKEIVVAQGGDEPTDRPVGNHTADLPAHMDGYISHVNNKAIIGIARAAGAPRDKGAGVVLHLKKGDKVDEGASVLTIHAGSAFKLEEALTFARRHIPVTVEGMLLHRIPDYREIPDVSRV